MIIDNFNAFNFILRTGRNLKIRKFQLSISSLFFIPI